MRNIDDTLWLKYNLNPLEGRRITGFPIPDLPPEKIQLQFTGRAGEANMEQAFAFYKIVLNWHAITSNSCILDFGAGWGRISRLFLREVNEKQIWSVDPYSTAIEWMKKTNLGSNILKIETSPPIEELDSVQFDVIYAYSVFSHLSEQYFVSWSEYLLSLLKPGGNLIFTTRGRQYIDFITERKWKNSSFGDYKKLLRSYQDGDFLFFQDRGAENELSGSWYGEAFIPEKYARKIYGDKLKAFISAPDGIDQSVIVVGGGD